MSEKPVIVFDGANIILGDMTIPIDDVDYITGDRSYELACGITCCNGWLYTIDVSKFTHFTKIVTKKNRHTFFDYDFVKFCNLLDSKGAQYVRR